MLAIKYSLGISSNFGLDGRAVTKSGKNTRRSVETNECTKRKKGDWMFTVNEFRYANSYSFNAYLLMMRWI